MRALYLLLAVIGLVTGRASGQEPIQITSADLPGSGNTFRMSVAANPQAVDLAQSGANQTWNYTNLNPATQYVDTFRSLSNLPQVYSLLAFQKSLDFGKEAAALLDNLPMADQLPISNVTSLYGKDNGAYKQVAFGVEIGGQNIPVPFETNDRIYNLPLTYQQKDSSESSFSFPPQNLPIPVPDSGLYFEENRKRLNTVDGWGTLQTPYGNFEVLRVKTVIQREDSVSLQGVNQAIEPPDQVIFRWLAKDGGNPILQVRAQRIAGELVVTNAAYQDSARDNTDTSPTGLADSRQAKLKLYPNPATSTLNVSYSGSEADRYTIFALSGQLKQQGQLPAGSANRKVLKVDDLSSGLYLFRLANSKGGVVQTQKLLVR
jgi:hypothetical protein